MCNHSEPVSISEGQVRRIAIIGGGASGAVTLNALIEEQAFDEIHLYERSSVAGGVWVLDEGADKLHPASRVPPGAKPTELDPPLKAPTFTEGMSVVVQKADVRFRFTHTPSYKGVRTNIPQELMTYSDRPYWDHLDRPLEDTLTTRDSVQRYITAYLNRNQDQPEHSIIYNTTVESVIKTGLGYTLTTRTAVPGSDTDTWRQKVYDAVVVATGHYSIPKIPDVPGLKEVFKQFPERLEHAKLYRGPEKYAQKRVLLIGARASGVDLSHQISRVSSEVYLSTRSRDRSILKPVPDSPLVFKPMVERYAIDENRILVHFTDGSVLEDPHLIIYGTGYYFSYPFLREQYPDFVALPLHEYLPSAFQHTFYTPDPLITTVGVPIDALSFRAFEYQAVLIARFYAGKVSLPSRQEQLRWGRERIARMESERPDSVERGFHTVGFTEAVQFRDDLTALGGGVEPLGSGKAFPVFDAGAVGAAIEHLERRGIAVPSALNQRKGKPSATPPTISVTG